MKLPAILAVITIFFMSLFSTSAMSQQGEVKESSIRTSKTLSGEDLYPGIKRLELADVREKYNTKSAIFIDARNSYEYGTIQVKGAINVPVNDPYFVKKLEELRSADSRPIIFYCNGLTCMKSFRAAKTAMDARIKDVYVYPYGILSWAKAYPDDALLFGKVLNKNAIISDEDYKVKKLSPVAFYELREKLQEQSIALDIRTLDEIGGVKIWPGIQYNVKQDNEAIKRYVDKAKAEKKKLLIYDESGHQIRWLQYYLRSVQFEDYYFLDGGHENYMRMIDKDGQFVMSEYMRERLKAQTQGGQID
jgi:rhodanese-related sulfurtransferase